MNIVELILFIMGAIMFPYGVYEIIKGDGNMKTKLFLIFTSITLFTIESILVYR
ncbi:conserved hypothetical protein [Metallosphaera cuprina Ar-4]|uniref:Uncharacterized protein n=1 Tax=Metallosphaera cuprina (strain Ar-4) TaxID=1006006 RepID=F4FYA8_METCR|nr:conserved hypothetical protein [Metallosphaera cuprina Ar-4]